MDQRRIINQSSANRDMFLFMCLVNFSTAIEDRKGSNEVQSVTIFTHLVEAHMSIFLSLVQDQVNAFPNSEIPETWRCLGRNVMYRKMSSGSGSSGSVSLHSSKILHDCVIYIHIYISYVSICLYIRIYMGVFENDAPKEPKSHWNRDHAQPMEQWI